VPIALERITPAAVLAYKQVRLRALADVPSAFGSTYAREVAFSGETWLARATRLDGDAGVGYIARADDEPCGLGLSFLGVENPAIADLVSFWVAPEQRGSGAATLLLDALTTWAASRGASTIQLMVTSKNNRAIAFYRRCGFIPTGRTEPYSNDPALHEIEMARTIAG
jgi:ribosomal protein S18 acetylase RimI-like enzyme